MCACSVPGTGQAQVWVCRRNWLRYITTPGGRYLPVGTGNFDLGAVYRSLVASAERRKLESETIKRYEEKFQIFALGALLLLLCEPWISERRRV